MQSYYFLFDWQKGAGTENQAFDIFIDLWGDLNSFLHDLMNVK